MRSVSSYASAPVLAVCNKEESVCILEMTEEDDYEGTVTLN